MSYVVVLTLAITELASPTEVCCPGEPAPVNTAAPLTSGLVDVVVAHRSLLTLSIKYCNPPKWAISNLPIALNVRDNDTNCNAI
ncbi:hypothetical protein J6590_044188, partial [Homalodisca vitripennis]